MDPSEVAKYAGAYINPPTRIELSIRDGTRYFRRGTTGGEATKIGDLRFAIVAAPGARPQEFARRAFKRAPTTPS